MLQKNRIIPPPLFFLLCGGLGVLLEHLHPLPIGHYSRMTGVYAACLIIIGGSSIGLWALREMRRNRTPVEPWKTPVQLVTSGPFRFSRNPIYVMFVAVMIAVAVAADSLWLVLSAVLLIVVLDLAVIRREETLLGQLFGGEYAEYRSRVRRWL